MKKRIIPILILTTTLLASCGTSNTESTASIEKEQTDISTEVAKDTEQTIETETPTETEIEHNLDDTEKESTEGVDISGMEVLDVDKDGKPYKYRDPNTGNVYDKDGSQIGVSLPDGDPYRPHAKTLQEEDQMVADDPKEAIKAGAYKPNPTYGYKLWIFQRDDGTTYVKSAVDGSTYEVGEILPDGSTYIGCTEEDFKASALAQGFGYVD